MHPEYLVLYMSDTRNMVGGGVLCAVHAVVAAGCAGLMRLWRGPLGPTAASLDLRVGEGLSGRCEQTEPLLAQAAPAC